MYLTLSNGETIPVDNLFDEPLGYSELFKAMTTGLEVHISGKDNHGNPVDDDILFKFDSRLPFLCLVQAEFFRLMKAKLPMHNFC